MLDEMDEIQQRAVLRHLRSLLPLHPVELQLMVSSEAILDALHRAGEFTTRMIRGVFAEAAFSAEVIPGLGGEWRQVHIAGADRPYDALVTDQSGEEGDEAAVRVQVKMQRSKKGKPLMADQVWKQRARWPKDYFIVEVQKSRKGDKGGKSTRPYRYGQFDILAVSLGPSTGRWSDFIYTVERWLIPDPEDAESSCILKYQPVPPESDDRWTKTFPTVVEWFRSNRQGRIQGDLRREAE